MCEQVEYDPMIKELARPSPVVVIPHLGSSLLLNTFSDGIKVEKSFKRKIKAWGGFESK